MVFPQLGAHDMEGFFPPLDALFDKRAEYPVLLVEVVEESANVPMLAEAAAGALHGTATCCHLSSPPSAGACQSRPARANKSSDEAAGERALTGIVVTLQSGQLGWALRNSTGSMIQSDPSH